MYKFCIAVFRLANNGPIFLNLFLIVLIPTQVIELHHYHYKGTRIPKQSDEFYTCKIAYS